MIIPIHVEHSRPWPPRSSSAPPCRRLPQPPGRDATTIGRAARFALSSSRQAGRAAWHRSIDSRALYRLEPTAGPAFPRHADGGQQADLRLLARTARSAPMARSAASSGISAGSPKATVGSSRRLSAAPRDGQRRDAGRAAIRSSSSRTRGSSRRPCPRRRRCAPWPWRRSVTRIAAQASPAGSAAATFSPTSPHRFRRRASGTSSLQSADAAVWISGLRPRGRGFELDPGARVDTGRWRPGHRNGAARRQPRLDRGARDRADQTAGGNDGGSRAAADTGGAATDGGLQHPGPGRNRRRGCGPIVRVQFSRDMDARSFKDRVRVSLRSRRRRRRPTAAATADRSRSPTTSATAASSSSSRSRSSASRRSRSNCWKGSRRSAATRCKPWSLTFHDGTLRDATRHEHGRSRAAGGLAAVSHPRYRSRARLRRPDARSPRTSAARRSRSSA